VVVGETKNYNFDRLEKAINLVRGGAKLIGTNCDLVDKSITGFQPACGTLVAPIVLATGVEAYFVGKPNPLIMRSALDRLGSLREDTVIIGDRMDTDILSGTEADIDTVLVLTGVTSPNDLKTFSYRPNYILDSIADLTRRFYS
jgi:NagD protein